MCLCFYSPKRNVSFSPFCPTYTASLAPATILAYLFLPDIFKFTLTLGENVVDSAVNNAHNNDY